MRSWMTSRGDLVRKGIHGKEGWQIYEEQKEGSGARLLMMEKQCLFYGNL